MINLKDKKIGTAAVAAIAIISLVAGFGIGWSFSGSKKSSFPSNGNFQQMRNGGSGQFGGARQSGLSIVSGEVMKLDANSMTVKTEDGSSKVVYFSESTVVSQMATSSVESLQSGKQVIVSGKENSNGFLTVSSIQIRPEADFSGAGRPDINQAASSDNLVPSSGGQR